MSAPMHMAWIRGLSDIPMKNARIKVRVIKPFSNKALVEYEVSLGIVTTPLSIMV